MLPSNTTSIYIDVSTYPLRVPLFRSIINPLSEERGRTTRIRSVLSFPFFFLRRPFPCPVSSYRVPSKGPPQPFTASRPPAETAHCTLDVASLAIMSKENSIYHHQRARQRRVAQAGTPSPKREDDALSERIVLIGPTERWYVGDCRRVSGSSFLTHWDIRLCK